MTSDDPASFAVKELESLYLNSGYEIDTNSIRMFVAFYTGLRFDTTGQEIYLPRPAAEILYTDAPLTSDQVTYLETYTVDVAPASGMDLEPVPTQGATTVPQTEVDKVKK